MNKKELTKKMMERMQNFGYSPSFTNVKVFIQEYEKLTKPKPQKPVVPQFVAEWYEEHKGNFDLELWDIIYEHGRGNTTAMSTWIDFTNNAIIVLVNMHQFGYEIEEEKRYTVKIVAVNQYLVKNPDEGFLGFLQSRLKSKFTKKELEDAGFGEVFNSPLFEVKEVEE